MNDFLCLLKALADETRFNIVKLLLDHDYCVRALAKRLAISEAAVSQHLQVLRKAGVVRGEKRGYFTHYRVENDALESASKYLLEMIKTNNAFKDKCKHNRMQQRVQAIQKVDHE
ncbi:MAG: metalloregulator ArsR/SmtB family transcription factor [Thermotogota bacterium]|nr:metalloregulator ArsR/SmtB family transcription factor [Thermotogota bacterium]